MSRNALRFAAVFGVVVAALTVAGCPKKEPAAAAVDAGNAAGDDVKAQPAKINAVFDASAPQDPKAVALCNALVAMPEKRRQECCQLPAGNVPFASTCAGLLSSALAQKAVAIDDAKSAACVDARQKQLEGCGWVGAIPVRPPEACADVLTGDVDAGGRCRSSLECKRGLRCHGVGPLDTGRCGPPLADGRRCGAAVDGLSAVVPQVDIDRLHPECEGLCILGKCASLKKAGEACANDNQCGADNRCDAGKCAAGKIALGKACVASGCVDGARCMSGTCQKLRRDGESCGNDFDCERGGCVKNATGQSVCGMRCNIAP